MLKSTKLVLNRDTIRQLTLTSSKGKGLQHIKAGNNIPDYSYNCTEDGNSLCIAFGCLPT